MAQSVVDPKDTVPSGAVFPPPNYWQEHSPNTANEFMPGDTTINR